MTERVVLCFGDSNTHGTVPMADDTASDRHPRDTRWPGVLAAHLGPEFHVIEEGHPGRTTVHDDPIEGTHRNGRTVLPAILETHQPIDLMVLKLGTNDLKTRFAVTPADIARSLGHLIDMVQASKCGPKGRSPDIVLVAPAPILETGWLGAHFVGGAVKSKALAPLVADLARRRHLGFVDTAQHAAVDPLDGVHLAGDAHKALGAAVAEAVGARLQG